MEQLDKIVRGMFMDESFDFEKLKKIWEPIIEFLYDTEPGEIIKDRNRSMSVSLNGRGNKHNPSKLIYLPKGRFGEHSGDNEKMICHVFGEVYWGISKKESYNNPEERLKSPHDLNPLIIPPGRSSIIDARTPTIYVCDYRLIE